MSTTTFAGNSESGGPGFCPAPPPPPPPPPVPGQVPALRINTVEAPVPRRPLPNNNPYEPPAAIQNAMMTKDKKPFTYTPGMGGKLDLSQIRSPRMARRVAKNANDEGIEGPPKSSLATESRPLSTGSNLYIQPQVAVPVFPTNVPLQSSANRAPSAPANRVPSNASDRVVEVQRPVTRIETKPITQVVSPQPTPPETPTTPPQVTLAKAPTPWLQNKNKPQEELPEWAKRASVNRPSSSTSPESPTSQPAQIQINQAQPVVQQTIQLQQPPISRQHQPPPPPRQQSLPQERVIPLRIEDRPSVFSVKHEPGHHQFKQQPQPSPHHQQRWGNSTSPQTPPQAQSPQFPNQHQQQYQQPSPRPQSSGGGTYIVPIMVEGSSNGNSGPTYVQPQQVQPRSQPVQNQSPRVIIQRGPPSPQIQQQGEPGPLQSRSFRVLQKITDTDVPDGVDGSEQLRKLQLTEDDKVLMSKFKEQGRQWVDLCTDQTNGGTQQPADRDGSFDHTFVVDGEGNYLHQEEDPRYRGAAIPSRAFRFLQNMTESGDVTSNANAQRGPSAINKRQNRNSRTFEESQANLPASEQQAPEPKKYTGSAIPSRSFRILQAMTAPESIAKQENRQAVVTCRTESSNQPVDHQQILFLSSPSSYDSSSVPIASFQSQSCTTQSQQPQLQPLPPPFWQYPEGNCWWGYYPVNYSSMRPSIGPQTSSSSQLPSTAANNPHNMTPYESYACCTGYHHHHHHHPHHLNNNQDGNAFVYYHPIYDQRLYAAAAFTAPNGSISSSSSPSFSSDAANSAVRQSTETSSSSEEAMIVSNELFLPGDTGDSAGTSSNPTSSSFSSSFSTVPSRVARLPSAILHPTSPVCFVPAFIHHQLTKESPGNCNPCLERTAAGPGTNFRSPPTMFVLQNSSGLGEAGRIGWPCQDLAPTELGPPPWSQNCQYAYIVDRDTSAIGGSEEKSAKFHAGVGYQANSGGKQREETLIRKEDNIEKSGKCGASVLSNKIDVSTPNCIKSEQKNSEGSGRNDDLHSERTAEREVKEVERSGRNGVSTSVNNINKVDAVDRSGRKIEADKAVKVEETRWNRIDNASRNVNELDAPIQMNILHEEKNANDSRAYEKTNINDASLPEDHDSEDGNGTESDLDSDSTSIESSVDAEAVCTDPPTNTEETSSSESDSDDSDSYLAYSTGLNPHNKFIKQSNSSLAVNRAEKEFRKSQTSTTIDEDAFDERSSFAMSFDRLNSTDCESCAEEDDVVEEETKLDSEKTSLDNLKPEENVSHRLSVILEDTEQNKIGSDGWQDVPVEPPDDLAVVNVSLPLRFRLSVKDNEEKVAVADNSIKSEETLQSEDVYINLKVTEDATVNFTLRQNVSQEANEDDFDFWATRASDCKTPEINSPCNDGEIQADNATESKEEEEEEEEKEETNGNCNEDDCIDFWETLKSGTESPDFNFNLRWAKSKSEVISGSGEALVEEKVNSEIVEESVEEDKASLTKESTNSLQDGQKTSTTDNFHEEEMPKSLEDKEEVSPSNNSAPLFELTEAKAEDINENEEETESGGSNVENTKHLLSVQNSRDETDDEDSGVTSDMSRLISEVDTDSECGPTRKMNSYKRTQTHSRLFRLLSREDDATQVAEEAKSSSARDRLSLPLKNSGFSYDESHQCSNYSSGLTSPDYSPVYEGSWRRLQAEDNVVQQQQHFEKSQNTAIGPLNNDEDQSKNRYFDTWKKTQVEVMVHEEKTISSTSRTSKTLGVLPSWRFKTNVLCPRIKSTKNVPKAVRQNRPAKPVITTTSTKSVVNIDKC